MKKLALILSLIFWQAAKADLPHCDLANLDPAQRAEKVRQSLLEEIRAKNLPAFVKQIGANKIPVVLMNTETETALKPFTDHSIGTEIMAKAGWPNNHGSFRYGDHIIDAFMAGQRQVGEINQTGLSWKRLHDTNVFIDKIADVMVEVAYYVSPAEMQAVDFYQRVRRAALYRVIFQMGDLSIYKTFDNVLSNPVYCFQFSKCSNVQNEITELDQKIKAFENSFADFKQDPALKTEFLNLAKAQLLAGDLYAVGANLTEKLISTGAAGDLLTCITPPAFTERQRQLYANYLVGHEAAQGFSAIRGALNISDDSTDGDQTNPRVYAIFVYLKGDHADAFRNANVQIGSNRYQFNMQGATKVTNP